MKLAPCSLRLACAGILLSCFTASGAFAEGSSLSPFAVQITSPASFDQAISGSLRETSQVTVINPVNLITLGARTQTLGNLTFRFDREWHVPDASFSDNGFGQSKLARDGVHLQGTVEYRGTNGEGVRSKITAPAAATLYRIKGTNPQIQITFFAEGGDDHFYEVSGTLKGRSASGELSVRRISHQAFSGRSCAASAGGEMPELVPVKKSPLFVNQPLKTSNTYLSFDLATEADYDWFARYGNASNTKIQAILNQVQTIYRNQLGLAFNLTKQVVVSTSGARYNSSNVDTLLSNFRTYTESNRHLGSADLYHLFTGKDTFLDDDGSQNFSVIGLAYLGVTCAFPTYSYGLTEDLDDALNHVTTAHELGHNFNAEHDAAGSIMGTTLNLNNPPTQFSNTSKNQISSWVNRNSSCLSSGTATPTPGGGSGTNPGGGDTSHVSLNLSLKNNGTFTATTGFSEVEAGCSAELRAASSAGKAYTGTLLATLDTGVLNTSYRNVKLARRVSQFVGRSRKVQKVYIGVTKTCPSGTYYSVTRSIAPYKVKSTKPPLTLSKWIRTLAQRVKAANPQ